MSREKRGHAEVEKQIRIAQVGLSSLGLKKPPIFSTLYCLWQAKLVEMRQRRAEAPNSLKDDRAVQKQIRILEDRLDKVCFHL